MVAMIMMMTTVVVVMIKNRGYSWLTMMAGSMYDQYDTLSKLAQETDASANV